jgi:acyl-CoA reductase-like NAD-dependent aldehyde dehydrogenase
MRVFSEEDLGPATSIRAEDPEYALAIANSTPKTASKTYLGATG